MEVRNFPSFSAFFHNYFLLVHPACLLVPCVSPVQKYCFLRLREVWLLTAPLPQFPASFLQLDLTLPDCNPPHLFPFHFGGPDAAGP